MLLHEKKPVATKPKHRAARSGNQQPRGGGTFIYKHVMGDLGKTSEETGQEKQLYVTEGVSGMCVCVCVCEDGVGRWGWGRG